MTGILEAASALVDDFVTTGSFTRDQVSACDYGILDKVSGTGEASNLAACAIVFRPGTGTYTQMAYGGIRQAYWNIRAEGYIPVTGNIGTDWGRVWRLIDAIDAAVAGGATIQASGGARTARVSGFIQPQDILVEFGGNDFIPVYVTVEVRQDP